VDVGNDPAAGNGRLDEGVQLFVTPDGQLQVAGCDSLHLEVLGGVAGQLEHLGRQVLQDGRAVDGRGSAHPAVAGGAALEVAVDPSHGELEPGPGGSRHRLLLGLAAVLASLAACHFHGSRIRIVLLVTVGR